MRLMPILAASLTVLAALAPDQELAQSAAAPTVTQGKDGITLPAPPAVKSSPVVDEYQSAGSAQPVKVTDNYRWLEDAQSPETRAFIAAQNAYTKQYLDQLKILPQVREQLTSLLKVDVYGVPERRGDRFFFTKRLASENQASIY